MSHGSLYEQAFSEGERAAYRDRKAGKLQQRPDKPDGWYQRAWWDGYTPRTSAWATRPRAVVAPTVLREYA